MLTPPFSRGHLSPAVIFWLLNFSIVTSFVPDPVLAGFTTGAAFIIITSNMKHALGIVTERGQIWEVWISIFENFGKINWAAVAIFSVSFFALLGIKEANKKYKDKLPVPIPEQLVVLIVSTAVVALFDIDVPTVKEIPEGLYTPRLPSFDDLSDIIKPSLVCSIVTYILTVNVTKALGNEYGYEIDANQEFIANAICAIV